MDAPPALHSYLTTCRGDRTQTEVATALGVSQATISSWESDDAAKRVLPRAKRLPAVAEAYGADLSTLRDLWHRAAEVDATTEGEQVADVA